MFIPVKNLISSVGRIWIHLDMYTFTPEEIRDKLLDLQAAFEKLMSHPKPNLHLANQLKRDIAFYTALQKDQSTSYKEGQPDKTTGPQ